MARPFKLSTFWCFGALGPELDMGEESQQIALSLGVLGEVSKSVKVEISYDVLSVLSEQLYASPLKAIEELVPFQVS